MKNRGPIRYQSFDEGERPTASRLANVIAINQVIADPDNAAATSGLPQWYVIRTEPGRERIAAAHLAGRRFGVYAPERKTDIPMMAGYVLCRSYDIAQDTRRIQDCPGIIDLLRYASGAPAFVTWDMIDWLREQENFARGTDEEAIAYTPRVRKRRPRRSKKIRRRARKAETLYTKSLICTTGIYCST